MHKRYGFTIVELLIVIVIIAILAAITIVAYNGVQTRGENTKTIAGVNQAVKLLVSYKTVNGDYPNIGAAGSLYCIGAGYTGGVCLTGNDGTTPQASTSSAFDDALKTNGTLPSPSTKQLTLSTGQVAAGANFQYSTKIIRYHLSGGTATCDSGGTAYVYGAVTQCRITLE